MNRLIPYELLTLLESRLSGCYACVSSLIACHMQWSLVPGLLIPTARRTQLFPFPFTPNVTPLHPTPPNFFSSDFHESHDRVWCLQCFCLQCFDAVGWAAGRAPACKKLEWWGTGMVICLERGADLHMARLMPLPLTVCCLSKIQIGFTILVPAHPGSPGKRAVKRVCVWYLPSIFHNV